MTSLVILLVATLTGRLMSAAVIPEGIELPANILQEESNVANEVECNSLEEIENAVLTVQNIALIPTKIGTKVSYKCNSLYTKHGRVGTATCNAEGEWETNILCEDCSDMDNAVSRDSYDINDIFAFASQFSECFNICFNLPGCTGVFFYQNNICYFTYHLRNVVSATDFESCRAACYDEIRCRAILFETVCSLYAKPFNNNLTQTTICI